MAIKLLLVFLAICALWRWAFGQWPWEALSTRSTRQQGLHNARKTLGVSEGASGKEIRAAHKKLMAQVHPDRGGSSAKVHEANAARDLLLAELPDPERTISTDDDDGDAPQG